MMIISYDFFGQRTLSYCLRNERLRNVLANKCKRFHKNKYREAVIFADAFSCLFCVLRVSRIQAYYLQFSCCGYLIYMGCVATEKEKSETKIREKCNENVVLQNLSKLLRERKCYQKKMNEKVAALLYNVYVLKYGSEFCTMF